MTRKAGLPVELRLSDGIADLPAAVDVAAYRIVQESLANVMRHADASRVEVTVFRSDGRIDIDVADDGLGAAANGGGVPGHGIVGMRERAEMVGGRFEAGPLIGGGFRVHAFAAGRGGPVVIRVVLADDQSLIRAGLRALLDAEDDLAVVGEARDGVAAIDVVRRERPDVVVMDIRMPIMDGLEATRQIVADTALRDVKVVVLTTFELDEYVFEALRSGAAGFLVKDTEPVELLRAIRCAAAGDALLSPGVTRRLIAEFAARPEHRTIDTAALSVLTDREREIVALVASGLSNEEIADSLFISPATSRTHVSRAMVKLGARDRAQLVVVAYESGLVAPRAD